MLLKTRKKPKIFVLGIDGACFDVINYGLQKELLPAFSKLIDQGACGKLKSTIHPLTPQAWTSFLTGKNPGKHGIFDFGKRREGTYRIDLVTSRDRKSPGFWDFLEESHTQVGIVNIPLTFPPEKMKGFMITGMHTPSLSKGIYPRSLYNEINQTVPDYMIDAMSFWYQSTEVFLNNVWKMMDERLKLVKYLYKFYKPECFVCNFVGVDRVQHALWDNFNERQPGFDDPLLKAYKKMDEVISEIRDMIDDNTVFMVISDHGFGSLEKDVYLNKYLMDMGFLRIKPGEEIPGKNGLKDLSNPFESVDWEKTSAYSHGLFGNIFINLEGREPLGIIKKGSMYENKRTQVMEALFQLKDPDDEGNIVDDIYKKEDIYSGRCVDSAPDLVLKMRDYAYITRGGFEFQGEKIVSKPGVNHTGNHRLFGVLFALGEGIKPGYTIKGAEIIDIVPTLLYCLNSSIPYGLDGKILKNIFDN